MKRTLALIIGVGLLASSCDPESKNDSKSISLIVTMGIQQNIVSSSLNGSSQYYSLEEMYQDRSTGPGFHDKVKRNFDAARKMEKFYGETVDLIEQMRLSIVKTELPSSAIDDASHKRDKVIMVIYNLEELKGKENKNSTLNTNTVKGLLTNLYELRKNTIAEVVSSASDSENKYSFKDPDLKSSDLADEKRFNDLLVTAIEQSNVAPDDMEAVRKLYWQTTMLISDVENGLLMEDNILNHFALLSNVLNQVYELRYFDYSLLRSRFGGDDFAITDMSSFVSGPSNVKVGEEVKIEVMVGGYSAYNNPVVESNIGTVSEGQKGKGIVKLKADKPGVQKLNGTVTVISKSGLPKTYKWSHEVYVSK